MLFGSVPSPPRKPKSWTSTQSARQNTRPNHTAYRTSRGRPVRNTAPIAASAITTTRFTAKPLLAANEPNLATRADSACGCGVEDIDWTMPARVPGCPWPVPGQNPRPGQACSTAMPMKNSPIPPSSSLSQTCGTPGVLRQRDERPGHHVDQHRAGRPGQPAQPRREDPAERLPEHPHHQPPGHGGQPGQPGPRPVRRDQQPDADPDLDPHRRRTGLDGVVGPDGPAPVGQVLHPGRRGGRRRLDDLGGQPARHLGLGLQDPVQDPQQPEPDAQQPAAPGLPGYGALSPGLRRGAGRRSPPGPGRGPGQPEEDDDEQRDRTLVQQRRPERGDQRGVGRIQA